MALIGDDEVEVLGNIIRQLPHQVICRDTYMSMRCAEHSDSC